MARDSSRRFLFEVWTKYLSGAARRIQIVKKQESIPLSSTTVLAICLQQNQQYEGGTVVLSASLQERVNEMSPKLFLDPKMIRA